ncbi:MAG: hypothetical protein BRD49_06200 [Bacteroidetes bacterium SW_10_40_5]|nr:MAG: hypothetical protein BRD49_06200 [Bacteroidetes bacterium SW_10_40_5]
MNKAEEKPAMNAVIDSNHFQNLAALNPKRSCNEEPDCTINGWEAWYAPEQGKCCSYLTCFKNPMYKKMIYLWNVADFNIGNQYGNWFEGNYFNVGGERETYNIEPYNKHAIEGHSVKNVQISKNVFDAYLSHAVHLNESYGITVDGNNFNKAINTGIFVLNGSGFDINENLIGDANYNTSTKPVINGIHFKQTKASDVHGNNIAGTKNGMKHYIDSTTKYNEVYTNNFNENFYGLVAAPNEYPVNRNVSPLSINQDASLMKVKVYCNQFFDNDVGIIGSGNLSDQLPSSNTIANNTFDQGGTSQNNDWDIFWQEVNGLAFDYKHLQGGYAPNSAGNLNKPNYDLNGQAQNTTDHNKKPTQKPTDPCSNLKRQTANIAKPTNQQNVRIYPNPTKHKLQIALKHPKAFTLQIRSTLGKTIVKEKHDHTAQLSLPTHEWAAGQYVIRIIPEQGSPYHQQIVKIK